MKEKEREPKEISRNEKGRSINWMIIERRYALCLKLSVSLSHIRTFFKLFSCLIYPDRFIEPSFVEISRFTVCVETRRRGRWWWRRRELWEKDGRGGINKRSGRDGGCFSLIIIFLSFCDSSTMFPYIYILFVF